MSTVSRLARSAIRVARYGTVRGGADELAIACAELSRAAAEERFRVAFAESTVGMATVMLTGVEAGRLLDANAAYAAMVGREPDDLVGHHLSEWVHPDDLVEGLEQPLARLAYGDAERVEVDHRYLHREGRVVWAHLTATSFVGAEGRLLAMAQVVDLSERKRFEVRLQHLADHDALTGLHNRRRFEEDLECELARVRRFGGGAAVLVLDLDGFKLVNDSIGHAAGDELVIRLAAAIGGALRGTDAVARIGGDEFAVVLPEADEGAAVVVAEKLLGEIRRNGTVVRGERCGQVTASIGITTFLAGDELTAEDVLVEADIAMYDAKTQGKNSARVFRRGEDRRERITAGQSWQTRLREAIDQDRFVLYAQAIVPVCSSGAPGFELLLRLDDGHGDLIMPGAFLYHAERFELIQEIDYVVMTRAVRLLHEYADAGRELTLSINLSAKTLNGGSVAEHLESLLARHPIPEGSLIVEITETAAIANIEHARALARHLRALGCRLALDDFGAGFATFYYLKHLDFDYVKIDGEFVERLPATPIDQLVVRAVVDIARGLGTDTIAEFVQDDETIELLRDIGVGYAQGYHTGRPGPIDQVLPPLVAANATP